MTTAVLDACVLYSALLRDLWMHLTIQLVFQPKWTPQIQEEWIRNVLTARPDLRPELLDRTRTLMERYARDWELPDYEAFMAGLTLPDEDDRHVLAAAIAGGVPFIVTFNLVDFPASALAEHGVQAIHPDLFASQLLDAEREAFLLAVRNHRGTLRNPPKSPDEYLATLAKAGLARTAERLGVSLDAL